MFYGGSYKGQNSLLQRIDYVWLTLYNYQNKDHV